MNIPDHIAALIAQSLSKEISAGDEQELMAFLEAHPEAKQQYESLKKLWRIKAGAPAANDVSMINKTKVNRILEKAAIRQKIDQEVEKEKAPAGKVRRATFTYLRYAAVLLIMITSAALYFGDSTEKKAANNKEIVVAAQHGSKTRVLLPDGSTVWLNAGSKIYYKEDFSGATRDVKLCGEAFFDVVKLPDHPFIVHAGAINIKVLGTAFNVKHYKEDKTLETTLLRGAIEVTTTEKKGNKILMKPNEKLVVASEPVNKAKATKAFKKVAFQLEKIDTSISKESLPETAWMYNRLEFRGDTFEELAHKLERWYNVKIEFDDEGVKRQTFNGSFEKETIQQALNALQKVAAFIYKINAHDIVIKSVP